MNKKLNVLFICNKSPWPPREGGPIAMNNIIEGVVDKGHSVKVLAINTNKYNFDPKDIPEEYKKRTNIELVYIDLSIKPIPAFLNLFSGKSYHVQRFISETFRNNLTDVLNETNFDIVQIETLFMSPYIDTIREHSSAAIVLRAHNIEHLIWKRVASITKNPIKKEYLNHLAKTLEKYEKQILSSYDGIVPISTKDSEFFENESNVPVKTISFGVDLSKIQSDNQPESEHALFHIGAMNWIPNQEGIKWFLDNVWPSVNKEFGDLKLYLAGREMPRWLADMNQKNVVVVGEVPDAHSFIKSKTISIAPLFSGSGIRIKIIESMALGKAVISTTIGAEGINYTNKENIMIADDAESYLSAIRYLHKDRTKSNNIGLKARQLIFTDHNNPQLIDNLISFYVKLIKNIRMHR
jgi:glycosyltransferase involved in cell wall biosynthesis